MATIVHSFIFTFFIGDYMTKKWIFHPTHFSECLKFIFIKKSIKNSWATPSFWVEPRFA